MKNPVFKGMFAAAIVLPAMNGGAWAGGIDYFECSNATLIGEYAFGVTTYAPAPEVVAGIKVFDGRGKFTQRDYIGGSLPPLSHRKGKKRVPIRSTPTALAAW